MSQYEPIVEWAGFPYKNVDGAFVLSDRVRWANGSMGWWYVKIDGELQNGGRGMRHKRARACALSAINDAHPTERARARRPAPVEEDKS